VQVVVMTGLVSISRAAAPAAGDALPVLQPRLPEGQHHPVDAADLQRHVPGQDLSSSTR
jgi:hypothetical protein